MNLPLAPIGTTFQQQVWESLRTIPFGETRSYKEIAVQLGNPNAARAVGMANNKNPILIVTPCHRVIGANGKLVGFAAGLEMKKYLLALEGVQNER
ncbi:MAG: methylated-DNA--[protein]-cysteine S-methyltransferase [Turicibacter sp.]|nr:methylated-DNA--[protein]-cysteine S-methyltransferase [Turicibacter sp.]